VLTWVREEHLNLGWVMLATAGKINVTAPDKWKEEQRWKSVKDRIVLVHDKLFAQIVNSNLEVRTSVAIDPERGAAKDGALFTYEAITRGAFLTMEAVLDDYRDSGKGCPPFPAVKTKYEEGKELPKGPWKGPQDVVEAGLKMMEWLGIGGMGTRGFGRLAMVGDPLAQAYGAEEWR